MLRTSCEFCRRRKIKCTGELSGCAVCVERGQKCNYEPTAPMGRPRKKPRRDSDASESASTTARSSSTARAESVQQQMPRRAVRKRRVRKMSFKDDSSDSSEDQRGNNDEDDDDDDDEYEASDDGGELKSKAMPTYPPDNGSLNRKRPSLSFEPSTSPRMYRPAPMPIQLPLRPTGEQPFALANISSSVTSPSSSSVDAFSSRSASSSSSSLVSPPPVLGSAGQVNIDSPYALHPPVLAGSHLNSHSTAAPPPLGVHSHSFLAATAFGLKDAGWPTPLEEKIDAFRHHRKSSPPTGTGNNAGLAPLMTPGLMMGVPGIVGHHGAVTTPDSTKILADLYGLSPADLGH